MSKAIKDPYITVLNDKGLHTRPATELVKCVSKYQTDIHLKFQELRINAKSLLGILMLAAPKGSKIEIQVEGPDKNQVIKELQTLARNKFYMAY